jgi:ABC-2 type transport system permease protein
MKKILAIVIKDTIIRFSSISEWLFFLILPIIFTVVLAGGTGAPKDNRIILAVTDLAGSPLSAQLISELQNSDVVRPDVKELEEAEDDLEGRKVSAMLVIPEDFTLENLLKGEMSIDFRQLPNNLNAIASEQAVQAVISKISSSVEIAKSSVALAQQVRPFTSETDRQAYFNTAMKQAQEEIKNAPQRMDVQLAATSDEIEYDPQANSSAGQLITWVFIPLIGISGMFAFERQKGTLRRVLVTPTIKSTYLIGTIVGQVFWALVQMALLIGFGILVMKLQWGQNIPALIVILISSAIAAAALGVMLGAFVKTEGQATGLSIMIGMVMALLGGCWYPIELFPRVVGTITRILPTRWAMQGLLDLVLRGQGMAAILPEAGVLLAFAAVFLLIGIWRFKYE